MRKQYYLQPSKNGYYAWDVGRLISLSKDFDVKEVHLDEIKELDENYWYGGESDVATCRSIVDHFRLICDADFLYPIILSSEGRVMDGMHRVAKALFSGKEKINAVQFAETPRPDYEDLCPDELPYD